jgi:hypothetical protein
MTRPTAATITVFLFPGRALADQMEAAARKADAVTERHIMIIATEKDAQFAARVDATDASFEAL